MNYKNRQRGLSLIELMISIALGLTLMGAAMQFMLSTKRTYELNDDISRVQENGRLALDILVKDLQMAGYRPPLNGHGIHPNVVLTQCGIDTHGNTRPCAADGGTTISDTLSIQYDPPPNDATTADTDCLGTQVFAPATDIIVNVYTVQTVGGISSLYCRGYNVTTEAFLSAAQPLVDGIDNMQLLYRVTTAKTITTEATYRYLSFDQIAPTSYKNITAIRIGLLVSNGLSQGTANSETRQYQLLDSDTITYNNDRQPRRIYSTTVQFNNRSIR